MSNALRTLGALALLGGLASSASAQDCARIPTSAGAPDQDYASCARLSDVPAAASPSDLSFGHNASTSTFVNFAQNAPQVLLPVGPFTAPVFLGALDFQGNDLSTAYGLDTGGGAFSFNASNGSATSLGTLTPLDGEQWTAITYDYEDDTFYALASICGVQSSLYEVDFSPLTRTRIGSADTANNTCGVTLAANPATGDLFGYDIVLDQLLSFNKGTGATAVVGPLGFDANFGQAMDFDNQDGTLYAYAFDSIDFRAELLTVNTSTGATTFVGTIGNPVNLDQIGAGASKADGGGDPAFSLDATASTLTVEQGGQVTFDYTITNWMGPSVTGDLFFRAQLGVNTVARGVIRSGTLPAGQSFSGSFTQNVPPNAPVGTYDYYLNVGRFPNVVVDSETFQITVTPALVASPVTDWSVTNATPWVEMSAAEAVVATPNPFVVQTALRFALDEAADVRLAIYDFLGREVALLVDGTLEAGAHEAALEARGLAAGTYVYRLVVNDEVRTGRLTLAH